MSIANYLFGQTRSNVLSALFLHPDKSTHVRELARYRRVARFCCTVDAA
ncbi:hypothetical protein LP414_08530 [Polaromonas sp. P1(28)-13]|nr:hypothetical protein LP414_08530 [Polaromonas sp. P1(28)-13]